MVNSLFFESYFAAEMVARGLLKESYTVKISKGTSNKIDGYFVYWGLSINELP